MMNTGKEHVVDEIGVLAPKAVQVRRALWSGAGPSSRVLGAAQAYPAEEYGPQGAARACSLPMLACAPLAAKAVRGLGVSSP